MRAGIGGGWGSRITPRTGEFGFGKLPAPFSSAPPRSRLLLQSCQVRGAESRAGPSPPPLLRAVDERRDRIMVPKGGGDRPWTAVLSEGLPPRCSVSTCLCVHSSTNWSHRGAIGGGGGGCLVCHSIQGRQVEGRVEEAAARSFPSPSSLGGGGCKPHHPPARSWERGWTSVAGHELDTTSKRTVSVLAVHHPEQQADHPQ